MADALALVSRLIDQLQEKHRFPELARILRDIEPVLEDAEKRRVKEEPVRVWLDKLKDASCDIEDVLDECCSAAVPESEDTHKEEEEESRGISKAFSFVKVCFSQLTSCFCCTDIVDWVRIAKRIKCLRERLSEIATERHRFKFNSVKNREIEQSGRLGIGTATYKLIEEVESAVYGRDEDTKILISKLVPERSEGCWGNGVISIVGVGGMGKTTLARLAYNDQSVRTHFDLRIWGCDSVSPDEPRVAREILEAIPRKSGTLNFVEREALFESIRASIGGKKFLLVLDNAWDLRDGDFSKGYVLWKLLRFGAAGSRILLTARTSNIAKMMGATSVIDLSSLSQEDAWLMFRQRAFFGRDASECKQLERIGKKIVKKCYGLPLAIKTLAGLMHFKNTRGQWESVLREMVWELGHANNISTFDLLLFSYHDLPPVLRCCFSYCAIFPKGHVIERDNLIKMWMSQGYLGFNVDRNKEKEILGQECFMNLAMRSFFQDFETDYKGSIVKCKMHEEVHRLVQYVTRYDCFITGIDCVEESGSGGTCDSSFVLAPGADLGEANIEVARHSTFVLAPGAAFPNSACNGKGLRTLFTLSSMNTAINPDILLHLTCLRTLNLSRCWFKELPEEVGKFIHLRYLNLSSNEELEGLPETLCDLSNLQTLLINDCMRIRKLPERMGKLLNLRHLHIDCSFNLESLPKGIAKLTSLQTLDMLVLPPYDNEEAFKLGDLKILNKLEGYLHICRCGNLEDVNEAEKAELVNRGNLVDLTLDFDGSEERGLEDKIILEALQPHPNLESLEIRKYRGRTVSPDWLMSLTNLRRLILHSCLDCESLPPLGKLVSLESLEICHMKSMKKVGCEFLGIETGGAEKCCLVSFPKLRELRFSSLFKWNAWVGASKSKKEDSSTQIMPCLMSLEIDSCFCVKALPHFLKEIPLQNLTISKCKILQKHCQKSKGKEWSKISHIPNIKFNV
ncbi:unnamed protein product [Malus baccata var. baccata]